MGTYLNLHKNFSHGIVALKFHPMKPQIPFWWKFQIIQGSIMIIDSFHKVEMYKMKIFSAADVLRPLPKRKKKSI